MFLEYQIYKQTDETEIYNFIIDDISHIFNGITINTITEKVICPDGCIGEYTVYTNKPDLTLFKNAIINNNEDLLVQENGDKKHCFYTGNISPITITLTENSKTIRISTYH